MTAQYHPATTSTSPPALPGAPEEPYCMVMTHRLAACGLGEARIIPIDSLTAQKRLVEAGFGLALLPESSVDEELRLGTLRALRVRAMRATIPVVLIHRRRAYLSGAVRQLMALLAAWSTQIKGRRFSRAQRRLRSLDTEASLRDHRGSARAR